METTKIAIVGAGKGGYEFVKVLLATPNVQIKCVCDIDPNAKGVLLARQHQIPCVTRLSEFISDPEIDLIFESTGRPEVFEELNRLRRSSTSLIGSAGTRVIFSLLDSYNEVNRSLQSYKVNLERRIIERTEELEKLNAELAQEKAATEHLLEQQQELNEQKSKYLVHTTHQLKAPFAAIQNYVDIILDGYVGEISDETRDIVQKIRARCELLSQTIRDMLELAKLKAHHVDLVRDNFDLRQVVHEVAARFSAAAAAKRIKLEVQEPGEPLIARTVQKQLFELLATLTDNAIRYSHPDSSVAIILAVGPDDRRILSVVDHGIGIPKENLDKVFAEFFRSNNAVNFEPNGNGLGLAIVKEIADLLDISVEVESELDKGTTFHVRI
jgi:signal transduction histidine kinase